MNKKLKQEPEVLVDLITVEPANAVLSDEALEALAALLVDAAYRDRDLGDLEEVAVSQAD